MNQLPLVPSSKSILNRVLLLCTYLKEPLQLQNYVPCQDSDTFLTNLQELGFEFKKEEQKLTVFPPSQINKQASLYVKDAGTVYRFLLARLCFEPAGIYEFKITPQLQNRPIDELVDSLQNLGAKLNRKDKTTFIIKGTSLKTDQVQIDASRSSQFVSALYLLAPLAERNFKIVWQNNLVSAGYLQLTKKIMTDFGIKFSDNICVQNELKNPHKYFLEPDYSAASYIWLLGSLSDNPIKTYYQNSWQPDSKFWQILQRMGADVNFSQNRISVQFKNLTGIHANMQKMPDQVPSLVIAALFAQGGTVISNIEHLRYKETDRIDNIIAELSKMGADIKYKNEMLIIEPLLQPPATAKLEPHNDHRLYMSFRVLAKLWLQIEVKNPQCVRKSFPNFEIEMHKLEKILSFSQVKQNIIEN